MQVKEFLEKWYGDKAYKFSIYKTHDYSGVSVFDLDGQMLTPRDLTSEEKKKNFYQYEDDVDLTFYKMDNGDYNVDEVP